MRKAKIFLNKFKIRLQLCWFVLSGKTQHWLLLHMSDEALLKSLNAEDFQVDMLYHGVKPYVAWNMIKSVANSKDQDDMILYRAQFEAEALGK